MSAAAGAGSAGADALAIPTNASGELDFDALWDAALDVNSAVTRDAYAAYDRSLRRKRRPRTTRSTTDAKCRA